jgi:hypothetical protein
MTALEARVAPRHRAPRMASAADSHAQLIASGNRLLAAAETTEETTAQDVLGCLIGSLINALSAGEPALSERDLVGLVDRAANRLGCPPAPVRSRAARLAGLFAVHPGRWVRHV